MSLTEFVKVLQADAAGQPPAAPAPSPAEPSGGVLDLRRPGRPPAPWVVAVPFGTGAEDGAFSVRVVGWRRAGAMWVPVPLCSCVAELGATAGAEGGPAGPGHLFASALTLSAGSAAGCDAVSPGAGLIAHLLVPARGSALVQFLFAADQGVTGMNALAAAGGNP